MNDQMNQSKEKAQKLFRSAVVFTASHRAIIIFFIISVAVIVTLLQTRTFLDPGRNETRYQEEVVKIKYSTIDEEIVEKLKTTEEDANIDVGSNLVPDRNNPFDE
jgi:hypothetical protein